MKLMNVSMSLLSLAVLAGCTAEPMNYEESGGQTTDAFISSNALGTNALGTNALGSNALGSNALGSNALGSNALGSNALGSNGLSAVQNPGASGALARSFVRYLVACAYKPNQSFSLKWTDSSGGVHNEKYFGELGLAPKWETKRIDEDGKRMVSACMAAHVNFYGVHVTISMRSPEEPLRLSHHDDELEDFPNVEGAFWGNLWGPHPYINACYNGANVENSRDNDRDCAVGHLRSNGTTEECGIINIVGSCASVCKKYNAGRGHYEDCREQPGVNYHRTDLVITTALP